MTHSLIETARTKLDLVKAHAPGVLKTGAETLNAARDVVLGARDELKRTLKQGAERIGQKLANIATPTRKEAAEMHKAEIKAKKRAKRAEDANGTNADVGADGAAARTSAAARTTASPRNNAPARSKASSRTNTSSGTNASAGAAHGRDQPTRKLAPRKPKSKAAKAVEITAPNSSTIQ